MNNSVLVIITFIITALWDIILRWIAEDKLPTGPLNIEKWDFVVALKPYFKAHTLLGAAAIAGVVGAITQYLILSITKFPINLKLYDISKFLAISFLISGLIGFPMVWSGLFPVLNETYYKDLGRPRSFFSDAYSGVIVQVTLIFIIVFRKHIMNKI